MPNQISISNKININDIKESRIILKKQGINGYELEVLKIHAWDIEHNKKDKTRIDNLGKIIEIMKEAKISCSDSQVQTQLFHRLNDAAEKHNKRFSKASCLKFLIIPWILSKLFNWTLFDRYGKLENKPIDSSSQPITQTIPNPLQPEQPVVPVANTQKLDAQPITKPLQPEQPVVPVANTQNAQPITKPLQPEQPVVPVANTQKLDAKPVEKPAAPPAKKGVISPQIQKTIDLIDALVIESNNIKGMEDKTTLANFKKLYLETQDKKPAFEIYLPDFGRYISNFELTENFVKIF